MPRSLVRELVHLGWPVLVAQLAVMANNVIDTIMAGRYGTLALAAVGIGSSIYVSVFVALMGVLLALTPIVAHLYGAGRHADIGEALRQSVWLAAALALIALALFAYPDPFLALARLEPALEVEVRAYLRALAWSVPASLLFRVFYSFSTAISRPRTVMALTLVGLALKVPLNWVFMYGNLGAPELGSTGCAVATAIIAWIVCVLAGAWCWYEPGYRPFRLFARWSWPNATALGRILSLGLPIGLTFLIDVTGFTFMALFIARLGALYSAAHQIAANLAALSFMLPLALGNAASVVVGQSLGARHHARARAAGLVGLALALVCAAVVGACLYLFADGIAGLYTGDAGLRRVAAGLLAFVAVYHLFDAVQAVVVNVLRGYRRAVVPMLIYGVSLWGVGLGGGYAIGLTSVDLGWLGLHPPLGAPGFWLAAIASLVLASSLVTAYFLRVSGAESCAR
ncbi:MAG: MATE family efflux transporter [Burkholderiales bacterium]